MKELLFITHQNLTSDFLETICALKSVAWNYPIEDQKKWIELNVKPNDIHVLLVDNGDYTAYLNLVQTSITTKENNLIEVVGVGNVCAKVQKKGYGSALMSMLMDYFTEKNEIVILLCKKELIPFYKNFGYVLDQELKENVFSMSYNLDQKNYTLNGKLF